MPGSRAGHTLSGPYAYRIQPPPSWGAGVLRCLFLLTSPNSTWKLHRLREQSIQPPVPWLNQTDLYPRSHIHTLTFITAQKSSIEKLQLQHPSSLTSAAPAPQSPSISGYFSSHFHHFQALVSIFQHPYSLTSQQPSLEIANYLFTSTPERRYRMRKVTC